MAALPLLLTSSIQWTPRRLAGLTLWLRASDLKLNEGAGVDRWNDRSGNGYDVTQSTAANQPTYRNNVRNGKAVVRFDGVDDRLTRASTDFGGSTSFTVFVVWSPDIHTTTDYPHIGTILMTAALSGVFVAGTSNDADATPYEDVFLSTDNVAAGKRFTNASIGGGNWNLLVVTFAASTYAARLNGTAQTLVDSATIDNSVNTTVIGARNSIGSTFENFLDGDIAELGVYNRDLATAEIQQLEAYLNRLYALY